MPQPNPVQFTGSPGCVSQGDTEQEPIANIREAIDGYIESLVAHGDPIPD